MGTSATGLTACVTKVWIKKNLLYRIILFKFIFKLWVIYSINDFIILFFIIWRTQILMNLCWKQVLSWEPIMESVVSMNSIKCLKKIKNVHVLFFFCILTLIRTTDSITKIIYLSWKLLNGHDQSFFKQQSVIQDQ